MVYLLTPERLAAPGAPTRFRPHLLAAPELDAAVDSELPRIVLRYGVSARNPWIEDLVAALRSVDPLTARLLAVRNRSFLGPALLAEGVVEEGGHDPQPWPGSNGPPPRP